MSKQLLAAIDENQALEFLAAMVRFKSYSGTAGEGELAHFMADSMTSLGLDVALSEVTARALNSAVNRRRAVISYCSVSRWNT